jgi:hypothetical protein
MTYKVKVKKFAKRQLGPDGRPGSYYTSELDVFTRNNQLLNDIERTLTFSTDPYTWGCHCNGISITKYGKLFKTDIRRILGSV